MKYSIKPVISLRHLSDETLTRQVSGELNTVQWFVADYHLARCWQCRSRKDDLEQAARLVLSYRRARLATFATSNDQFRNEFLAKVAKQSTQRRALGEGIGPSLRLFKSFSMNPVVASLVVVVVAIGLLLMIWSRPLPTVSASEVLDRALTREKQLQSQHKQGVLYQQVSIRSSDRTIHRAIYSDLSGRRRARPVALTEQDSHLQGQLISNGVDWDNPLSAESYRRWRASQRGPVDVVKRTRENELTVETTVEGGVIVKESITVRADDYHPIRRTIETQGRQVYEIAELNYAVLGWSAVNEALFEPLHEVARMRPVLVPLVQRASTLQLQQSEIEARIALHAIGADLG
ncbi:MAG: hypothetical protein PW789_03825 [Edaphobacter sp.]|uniref:hypothetical protein n=1 Tax=Edaphobacter sp. TaxID=1934404 RepID=UPI00239747EC|nr:hypothetical protein [Edaphobacter sp.]MDE1175714.1 hypothetical protein [Edaphobacter sp.]